MHTSSLTFALGIFHDDLMICTSSGDSVGILGVAKAPSVGAFLCKIFPILKAIKRTVTKLNCPTPRYDEKWDARARTSFGWALSWKCKYNFYLVSWFAYTHQRDKWFRRIHGFVSSAYLHMFSRCWPIKSMWRRRWYISESNEPANEMTERLLNFIWSYVIWNFKIIYSFLNAFMNSIWMLSFYSQFKIT